MNTNQDCKENKNCQNDDCSADHQKLVSFDGIAAKNLSPLEIRNKWPRITCDVCKTVLYASYEHYIAGDW